VPWLATFPMARCESSGLMRWAVERRQQRSCARDTSANGTNSVGAWSRPTRQLGGLARHATLETRLCACQARMRVYQDVLEYFVEAPKLAAFEGPERARDAIIEGMAAAKVLRR
jgi:hypothetical protein